MILKFGLIKKVTINVLVVDSGNLPMEIKEIQVLQDQQDQQDQEEQMVIKVKKEQKVKEDLLVPVVIMN